MKMKDYINDFTNHLKEATSIGEGVGFYKSHKEFNNILICGLGGSGIGGTIINDVFYSKIEIPISSTKDYKIPNFVNEKTLVIASSYSGNTEETLTALKKCKKRNAEICIITSGGDLEKIAKINKYNCINIPSGGPPRAMFGYSFVQIFYVLLYYNIIDDSFKEEIKKSITLLDLEKENIKKEAKNIAKKLFQKTPVIYVANGFEGVAIRFRQQINENSKALCWHHVIPEMNHNELLGWRTNVHDLAVLFFRNNLDLHKNQIRIEINKKVIAKYTNNITEIWSQGDSKIQNTLYHINIGDWISWYLSELNEVDAIEIEVINFLKEELSKIK
ncbi:MAG: bifunctional phosphoglucose/phosphomannose isomerase [Candidatus Marinimicrobia bacterium]|nr:bifunctional phosphoglucose/phosphomannose isomerase [Candidatus Neomarinimicrobiota bacterium]